MASTFTVTIDYRARTAAYQGDLKDMRKAMREASKAIKDDARAAGDGLSEGMYEGRAAIALLGEEIGIKVPRHLRTFILELPGVGKAMSAAFNSVAIIALIGLLVEAGQKIKEYWESLSKLSAEEQKLYDQATKKGKELVEQKTKELAIAYDVKIAEASGIEQQRLKVEKAAALVKINRDYVGTLQQEKSHLEELLKTQEQIASQANEAANAPLGMNPYGFSGANMYEGFKGLKAEEQAKGTKKAIEDINKTLLDANVALTGVQVSGIETGKALTKAFKDSRAQVNELIKEVAKLHAGLSKSQPMLINTNAAGAQNDWFKNTGILTKGVQPKTPIYGGDLEAMAREKIKADQAYAVQEAQKLNESLRTQNQLWSDQIDKIIALYNAGVLTDKEFERALKAQADSMNKNAATWKEFGADVARVGQSALLMQTSWQNALSAILMDVVKLIVKMEILDKLGKGTGSGGGFFGSLLGGLFGGFHATGGAIGAGKFGVTGEAGPEVIYGGTSGVSVYPIRQGSSNSSNVIVQYHIDARGSSITEAQFRQSLAQVHKQSVAEAISLSRDRSRRGAA